MSKFTPKRFYEIDPRSLAISPISLSESTVKFKSASLFNTAKSLNAAALKKYEEHFKNKQKIM
jgi:hypothetical protein